MFARPLAPEELLARSDLAGYARVVSVRSGSARIRFSRILKGRPKGDEFLSKIGLSRTATVLLRPKMGRSLADPRTDNDAYIPDAQILTHLKWNRLLRVYETLWWNAVSVVDHSVMSESRRSPARLTPSREQPSSLAEVTVVPDAAE
jgi:hypothetical protein